MMILKANCFNPLLLLLFLTVSCGPLSYESILRTTHAKGIHSRGLDVKDSLVLVAGKSGVYSLYDYELSQLKTDSLSGATDIRDVHIFKDGDLLFLNSGEDGLIYKHSAQKGEVATVFDQKGIFLDGFDFWDEQNGIVFGDPVEGKFVILITDDAGESWEWVDPELIPWSLPNEAGFAASGSSIQAVGESTAYIGTGMADTARIFYTHDRGKSWGVMNTPMKAGDSYGIYSLFFWSKNQGVIVGGSYLHPDDAENNCFYTVDGGKTWVNISEGLGGYTSCITSNQDGSLIIATGRVGTFYSLDRGLNWEIFSKKSYYSVRITEDRIYFSGKDGFFEAYYYRLK